MTDNIYCLIIVITRDDRNIAAVQFKIKLLYFFYQSKQVTDYIYTGAYCKLPKFIEQTLCSYEHYLVHSVFVENEKHWRSKKKRNVKNEKKFRLKTKFINVCCSHL